MAGVLSLYCVTALVCFPPSSRPRSEAVFNISNNKSIMSAPKDKLQEKKLHSQSLGNQGTASSATSSSSTTSISSSKAINPSSPHKQWNATQTAESYHESTNNLKSGQAVFGLMTMDKFMKSIEIQKEKDAAASNKPKSDDKK